MAQYDGSIRIKTEIESKQAKVQLSALENRMVKTADKIALLRSKMDAMKDVKVPTKDYAALDAELSKLGAEYDRIAERQSKFLQTGGKEGSSTYKRMEYDLDALEVKQDQVIAKMKELEQSGKAFTLGSDTEEYAKLGQQLGYAESSAEILSQKHDILEKKIKLNSSGYKKLSAVAKSALAKLSGMMGNIASSTKKVVSSIGRIAASFLHIGKNAKSASGSLKTMLKNALGISSLYMLFDKLRSAIKEGFGNLAQYSAPVNAALSSLKSSLAQLKNSLTTAFAPILTAVAPALNALINMVTKAVNAIGMLIAALTGQKSYTKAAAAQEDYAQSLNKTAGAAKKANRQLSNLDKLNNLTSQDNSGGGGGGGGTNVGDMFEDVDIPSKIQKLANMIKKAWENADFTEIGKMIGKKLKKALDSIPWGEIQNSAKKIGSSIATLINGFVEVKGLGYSIGKTLSEAFNTAFKFLNKFVHKLHWKSIGKFIADTMNGMFETIDWETIKDTFTTGAKGLADLINSFVDWFHWDNISDSISNGINTISETIYIFFAETHFDELGQKLGEQLRKSIEKTDWEMIGRAIGSVIQSALDFVISFVGELDLGDVAQAVIDVLKGFFETVDMGDLAKVIMTMLAAKLALSATASMFKNVSKNIIQSIVLSLSSGLGSGVFAGFASKLVGFLTADIGTLIAGGSLATIGTTIATALIGGITAAFAGWNIGQFLYEKITGETIDMSFGEQMKEIFSSFRDGSWKDAFKLWGQDIVQGLKDGIDYAIEGIGGWLNSHIFKPFSDGFKSLFGIHSPSTVMAENGKYIIQGLLEGLKNNISSVIDWLNNIPKWFKEKFDLAYKYTKNAFSGAKEFFSGVWKNIRDVFGNIAGWFKDKFTVAWTAVKNVFSKGGKIFDGIKDGILNGLKTVINGIIGGINKVIAVPFNGLNKALGKLKSISIAGAKPFGFLPNISVPQIPKLATGTVVPPNREFLAVLGDNKKEPEVVSPLSTMKQAVMEAIAESGITSGGGNDYRDIVVMIDGREVFRAVKKQAAEYKKQTGGKLAFT